MAFTDDHMAELNLLSLFNLSSINEGIKVHSHSASKDAIAAAERLHSKGLITQKDGGYLTSLGSEAAEHAQRLISVLSSDENSTV
jgi:uncharacterized protein (TIGR02647 family)